MEPRNYDFAELSSEAPFIGDQLVLIQHSASSPRVDLRVATISGYRVDDPGYDYFRIQTRDTLADGTTVMNVYTKVQGIRLPPLWLLEHEIGAPGEVWAIDAPQVASTALPILRSGRIHIERDYMGDIYVVESASSIVAGDSGRSLPLRSAGGVWAASMPLSNAVPWSTPVHSGPVYSGEVKIDGNPAPVGSILHARMRKQEQPDYWISTTLAEAGFFLMHVLAPFSGYVDATIEFWMDCRRSSTTATYDPVLGRIADLDLVF